MGYISVAEFRALTGVTDDDTARLQRLIDYASAAVDEYCRRSFRTVTEQRQFTASTPSTVRIDDVISITAISTDDNDDLSYSTSWGAGTYLVTPFNNGPKNMLQARGGRTFPTYPGAVKITATWGYASGIPVNVQTATVKITQSLHQSTKTALSFIITGSDVDNVDETVLRSMISPDVKILLKRHKKITSAIGI